MQRAFQNGRVVDLQAFPHDLQNRRVGLGLFEIAGMSIGGEVIPPHITNAIERSGRLFVEVAERWGAAHGEQPAKEIADGLQRRMAIDAAAAGSMSRMASNARAW